MASDVTRAVQWFQTRGFKVAYARGSIPSPPPLRSMLPPLICLDLTEDDTHLETIVSDIKTAIGEQDICAHIETFWGGRSLACIKGYGLHSLVALNCVEV